MSEQCRMKGTSAASRAARGSEAALPRAAGRARGHLQAAIEHITRQQFGRAEEAHALAVGEIVARAVAIG